MQQKKTRYQEKLYIYKIQAFGAQPLQQEQKNYRKKFLQTNKRYDVKK